MSTLDSKERFSNRVSNYVKFRPTYPDEAINFIIGQSGITPNSIIADIGSGTGKFTKLLLDKGIKTIAVEPNRNMREAAEKELSGYSNFTSVNASAEETTLGNQSIDVITVAQAFHWFDRDVCKAEWRRILKPVGRVVLIWNRRDYSSEFMREYQNAIMKYHGETPNETHDKINKAVFDAFYAEYETVHFKWSQQFDFDGLWGRAQSSSYSPVAGHPNHELLKSALKSLFDQYNQNGIINFEYDTEVAVGTI